jgi:opacity protein-like surface antigen
MMSPIKLMLATAALCITVSAQAQFRVEGAFIFGDFDQSLYIPGYGSTNTSSSPNAGRVIVGYDLHRHLVLEGMVGMGISGDSVEINGRTVPNTELRLQNAVGLYARPRYPITSQIEAFARLGFARVESKLSTSGSFTSDSDTSLSWGAGVSWSFNERGYVTADWMSYFNRDGGKVSGFSIGLGYRF